MNRLSLGVIIGSLVLSCIGCSSGELSNVADNASPSDVEEYKAMIKEADAKFASEMEEDSREVE